MQAYEKWLFEDEPSCSWVFLCGHSSSILKICLSFVYTKLGGVAMRGQSTLEMFQQEASQRQLCQSAAKTFWHVHVVQSALVWQINQNTVDEKQSRPT